MEFAKIFAHVGRQPLDQPFVPQRNPESWGHQISVTDLNDGVPIKVPGSDSRMQSVTNLSFTSNTEAGGDEI